MEDMEHLKMRWVKKVNENGELVIITDNPSSDPWYVCEIMEALPGDAYGERTADYICKLHNDSLSGHLHIKQV